MKLPADAGGAPASARTLRKPTDLVDAGLIPPERLGALAEVAERYAIAITPAVARLIDPADPADPIARQFVPDPAELVHAGDEIADPIGDGVHGKVKGIVHRYPDRVLLKPAHACPVYCRFCFRREMVGPGGEALTDSELDVAFDYIRARPEIFEAIVTGGDPFMLSPRRLRRIVEGLSAIPHLGVIRFHTRVPVVDPERVEPALVEALETEKGLFVAIHADHPREFSPAAEAAIRRLNRAGVALLGQSVLLARVNDDPAVLASLFRRMVALRIKPYYLHHPDKAPGTGGFRLPVARGRELVAGLRGHVSGLCQPHYVLDLPGGHGKVPLTADNLAADGDDWIVTDYQGMRHRYRD